VKQAHIYIHGVIGSYTDENDQEVKGVESIDVITQVQANQNAESFLIHIKSPGGLVDEGNRIYEYLESLKSQGFQVDTISDGDIGSIATKIFLAGQNRTIHEGHEFFIHNPWTQPQPGDSNQIGLELQALKQTEAELRAFYQQHTKITDIGLKGLMDKQTGMTADQALTLGFATKKISTSKVKAFALLNKNDMSKAQTLGQKIGAIIDQALGNKQEIKALDLELEGGNKVSVSSEDPANMVGADAVVTDENGQSMPAPDGEHKLSDGRILVVSEGKVKEVKPASEPQDNTGTSQANAPDGLAEMKAKIEALELANKKKDEELASLKSVNVQDQINKALDEFRNSAVAGQTPRRAFNNNGSTNAQPQSRTIAQAMAEKRDQRKKQINSNK
jgi:ATP-dependent protease ClpP protease subunit